MNYPTVAEYTAAVRLAEDNMATLTSLRPVLDSHGDPLMTSGNFAAVFKMHDEASGRDYAMKCFLRQQDGRQEAYQAIMRELEYVNTSYLTHFQYLDRELFVDMQGGDDNEFPVLLMDWVEGLTLDKYVRQHLDDAYALSLLAYQFSRMAMWLLSQPFAHGDLKPDNILVRSDGSLVLVDYDGMFVPAMQGQKARELGSPDFRHPLRTVDDFNEHIDDFALASILLSLKAIALDPTLIDRHAAPDRLLLSERDYRDLSQCAILKELYPSADPDLNLIISLFTIAHAKKSLANVSFRLLDIERPEERPIQEETISTKVTDEDKENAWTDEYGAKYSSDGERLLEVPSDIAVKTYSIKQGTIVICDYAFSNLLPLFISGCRYIQEITIPDSVTHIGKSAFKGCKSLQEITIPNSVLHIGDYAFSGCESLQEITIPNSVLHIGNGTFWGCKSLNGITIPNSVTHIGNNPFEECENLNRIVCKSNYFVFEKSTLYTKEKKALISFLGKDSSFTIPDSVSHIGDKAFNRCKSLQEITIPNSVTHIGNSAFSFCNSLQKTTIPNSVSRIENSAFFCCKSLQKISIPNSVTHIGSEAFWRCESLKEITIPDSVTHIGDSAFYECKSLMKIIIPQGTREKFEEMIPDYKDKLVEQYENILTEVTDKDLKNAWIDEYGAKYSSDGKRLLWVPEELINYSIKQGTKVICDEAFPPCLYDSLLQGITIPESVTHIGGGAFQWCESLRKITIPESVTYIGDGAFQRCESLQEITIPKSVSHIGNNPFCECENLKRIVCKSNYYVFENSALYSKGKGKIISYIGKDTSFIIPDSVTHIENYAFWRCISLQGIFIPNSVSHIGVQAFCGCESLRGITIPDSVSYIWNGAFEGCTSLQGISIPDSVTHIGDHAFERCESIQKIIIPDSVTHIGERAFGWCYSLKGITIPNSVMHIGEGAFKECSSLQGITIPDSVSHIGEGTFLYCSSLQEITIPDSVSHIDDYAFYMCNSLQKIIIPQGTRKKFEEMLPGYKDKFVEQDGTISTEVTNEDWENAWTDEYGAKYSSDRERLLKVPRDLKTYSIRQRTKVICNSAFHHCESIQEITIPNSVTIIGNYTFSGCESLQGITIPDSVTHIGNSAFLLCSSLKEITIPDSVSHIGDFSFSDCKSLKEITIPDSFTHIGDNAFSHCKSLQKITIPSGTREKFDKMLPDYKDKLVECSALPNEDDLPF